MLNKKTKIVATIGPATESEKQLENLFMKGVNVVRLNFSHGSHDWHLGVLNRARKVSEKIGRPIGILQDLSGPKIRIGDFYQERIVLKKGSIFTLTTKKVVGDEKIVYVNYKKLPKEIKQGATIFLDDGKKKLVVSRVSGADIICRVLVGGEIKGRRGVNLPGTHLSISSLTAKDRKDLVFGIKNGVDFVAVSFVRTPKDILLAKSILKRNKAEDIKVIAKIETDEAVENLDQIIEVSDGIMVARGDLAIEIPGEMVPFVQKKIIKKCNQAGIPVITATQMLESMIQNPVPTRAEVNDIANAIFDGTDAVMLSEETALGKYPLLAVETMNRVSIEAEKNIDYDYLLRRESVVFKKRTDAISYAALSVAHNTRSKAIIALSNSGFTARMISRHRPSKPVVVLTPNKKTFNQLSLSFACHPVLTDEFKTLGEVLERVKKVIRKNGVAKKDDLVVIVAGMPFGKAGTTNTFVLERV